MYGTVAHTRVKAENRQALNDAMAFEGEAPDGFLHGFMVYEEDGDSAWMVAVFRDRDSYDRNANDPRMHEQYVRYRGLMEQDPEWHDGEIDGM